jgi:hypothetical protein
VDEYIEFYLILIQILYVFAVLMCCCVLLRVYLPLVLFYAKCTTLSLLKGTRDHLKLRKLQIYLLAIFKSMYLTFLSVQWL